MNKARIRRVADAIEGHSLDLGFNMRFYLTLVKPNVHDDYVLRDYSGHDCGTVACIAGWGYAVMHGRVPASAHDVEAAEVAEWMGLRFEEWSKLFTPDGSIDDWESITQEQAVRTLRHLADSGVVDWRA